MRNGPDLKKMPAPPQDAGTRAADPDTLTEPKFPSARGVLTAEEIEALLRPKLPQSALDTPPVPQSVTNKQTPVFDAEESTPSPLDSRELQRLAARLSRALGAGTGIKAAVHVANGAVMARTDLSGLLNGKSSAIACLGKNETDIEALLCLPPSLADTIIARACGARGSSGRIGDGWALSAIDCALLEQLLEPFGDAVDDGLKLQAIETDIPYVSSLLAANEVRVTEFSVEAAGLHSELALIQASQDAESELFEIADSAAPITALTTARLARLTVPLSRITELKAGATLLLGLPADQPVQLLSGDRDGVPAYEGRMGRKGNKVAIKISRKLRAFNT